MEKRIFLILTIILFVNLPGFVSSEYECSGNLSKESGSMDVGEIKPINRVKIFLINPSVGRAAEIFVDVKEMTLTSTIPSGNVTFGSGFHEINLTGLRGNIASIKTDSGNEGDIGEKQIGVVGNLSFYVTKLSGTWEGGDANVQFFVGDTYMFLYDSNPEEIKTVGSIEYLFGVYSSDSYGAIIEVSKCEGEFTEITAPQEPEPEPETEDNSYINDSSSEEDIIDSGQEDVERKNLSQKIFITIIVIISFLFVLVGFFILYKIFRNKGKLNEIK